MVQTFFKKISLYQVFEAHCHSEARIIPTSVAKANQIKNIHGPHLNTISALNFLPSLGLTRQSVCVNYHMKELSWIIFKESLFSIQMRKSPSPPENTYKFLSKCPNRVMVTGDVIISFWDKGNLLATRESQEARMSCLR